jgi:hypothetical protein
MEMPVKDTLGMMVIVAMTMGEGGETALQVTVAVEW